ncbi:hypothetical protein L1887_10727 [Cichorium endivia]|nr:hypothetical protein L1887_10727 [Cichorium endivia]
MKRVLASFNSFSLRWVVGLFLEYAVWFRAFRRAALLHFDCRLLFCVNKQQFPQTFLSFKAFHFANFVTNASLENGHPLSLRQ